MRWLVETSLRLRVVMVALSFVLILVGMRLLPQSPIDVFPEFAPALVEIQTEAPGLSTLEVESLVSAPIENAVNGVPGLKTLRSKSVLGLSSVVLLFAQGTDLMQARQLTQERLALVGTQLPAVANRPVMLSPLSSTSRALKIGMWSKKLTQVELTTLARWTIRPRVMAVPGVANVAIWGQRDRQLHILVDPEKLRNHGVTLDDVFRVVRDAVAPASGGFVDTPNQRISLTHVPAVFKVQDFAAMPVTVRNGAPLLLGQVARLTEGHQMPIGDAVINDGPGLLLIVEKQPAGNTLDVTKNVEKVLESLKPGLHDVEIDPTIFRPATFIEMAFDNLQHALLYGCILVTLILIAFLMEWRTAAISLAAIPLSLVAAALVLYWRGVTMNTMVLAGFAIALGEVVDDAIIDVENITRRLRQNSVSENPLPALQVVLNASMEVRSAVVYATLIVVLVFLPVYFLEGLPGSFFRPLALSYVLAVLASLGVALTVTPAMCLILLPGAIRDPRPAALVRWMQGVYRRMLPPMLNRFSLAVILIVVLLGGTALSVPFLGEEFLPKFKEYDFLMHWVEKPGTSLEAMRRITIRASKELRAIPGVRNFGSHIGRAEVADEVVGPNFTELWISLDRKVPYDETVAKIQEVVDGYPGLYRDLLTYLKERIKEVLSGGGGSIVVRTFGSDLGVLRNQAQLVAKAMQDVPGVTNLLVEPQVLVPQLEARVKVEAAQRLGLSPGDIRRTAVTLVKGTKAGEIYDEQKIFDVMVWGEPHLREDVESLRRIRLNLAGNPSVPLGDVVDLRFAAAPNVIQRENASRPIDVSCNVKGRDLGSVAREIEERVKKVSFPQGYHPEFLGEYAARAESQRRLWMLGIGALCGIVLILYSDFESIGLTVLLFISLPFALVGAIGAVFLTGGVLSLGSLVGLVTVLGIAARNGIMLVSHYRHQETVEQVPFSRELVLQGSLERVAPILMTALATGLALLPIALAGSKPGGEIEHPMAVVILGGLATSTVLNLFLMPALYYWCRSRALRRAGTKSDGALI
ncbi:MAG TPA: efflux RND transporter permease subunit [Bryobacteraceae bacterium]|nr:efflux RND transporter permease subunit [Bryobacteraceae bacterium]